MNKKILDFVESLKYDDKGLIPVVVQDVNDNKVLMVAFMNKESLLKTLETKKAHYYSRSRKKLWLKGEESGNIQNVKEIYFDCDSDCLLLKIEQVGGASCHTGYRSCFYRKINFDGKIEFVEKKVFDPQKVYKK
jgi:phosphoribosyl-AMP cyclohydrolase